MKNVFLDCEVSHRKDSLPIPLDQLHNLSICTFSPLGYMRNEFQDNGLSEWEFRVMFHMEYHLIQYPIL
jgi:hypothetical protein